MSRKMGENETVSTGPECAGNGLKCVIGNQEKENLGEIIVFTAKWCGACKRRVPKILKKAEEAGFKVNLIDIDNVSPKYRKMARRVQFVPHIDYMGREIGEEDLYQLGKKLREG